ncbi:MAG: hypothetical protein ACE5KM_13415 [Planctomycetaceae bacterium]
MTLAYRLNRFWFCEASPRRLALLRLLVGGYALWYVAGRLGFLVRVAERTDPAFFSPVGVAALLAQPLPAGVYRGVGVFTIWLGVMFVMGCWHRVVGPFFAGCLLFLLCYRNSWLMVYHSENLLVLHVLILGVTRSADAWSLDAWMRGPSVAEPLGHAKTSWRYGWPIRLICTVTAATYLLAAVAKVAGPLGWSWATGTAMRGQVAVDALRKELLGDGASPLVSLLYDHVWLFAVLGVATLILEFVAPLAVFNTRFGRFWAAAAFLMHWGILGVMGIKFRYCLSGIAFAAFYCIGRARPLFKEQMEAPPSALAVPG